MKEYMVKRIGIREEERRKKISNTVRGSKAVARKTAFWRENGRKRERRQKICNENEGRREVV